MRFGKALLMILTVPLLLLVLYGGNRESEARLSKPSALAVQWQDENIPVWVDREGNGQIFLPSGAAMSELTFKVEKDDYFSLGSTSLVTGMGCDAFVTEETYPLTAANGDAFADTVTFRKSGGVATVFVDVASESMEQIHAKKGTKESGKLRLYGANGVLLQHTELASVGGRGNSSWDADKKSYNLECRQEADFLGMGAAKKWILQANALDPSHLRNKIVFDTAGKLGLAYSPEAKWVDLYLNGEYAGLYLLSERNEVHPRRVAVSEEGSFLVAKDWPWRFEENGDPYITTASNAALKIRYSDLDLQTLTQLWQSAENAILAEDGLDPLTGKHWTELIDGDSWMRKYLLEEVFGNTDGATLSQFFYYDGSEAAPKIKAGPVWDYDLSMGNRVAIPENGVQMLFANCNVMYGSPWPAALYAKPEYYGQYVECYRDTMRPLLEQLLREDIGVYFAQITQAARMNSLRWNSADAEEEVRFLQDYLTRRMEFLDSLWLENREYLTVLAEGYDGIGYCFLVEPGEKMPQPPSFDYVENIVIDGWYHRTTDTPVDFASPVTENSDIYLKYETLDPALFVEEKPEEPMTLLRIAPAALLGVTLVVLVSAEVLQRKRERSHAAAAVSAE